MNVFDMHVHIFPDKIADKAVSAIGGFYEDFNMEGNGQLDSVIRLMDEAGVTRCAAHSAATTARQVGTINDFVMDAWRRYPDRILPFATMHPGVENPVQTAEDIISAGFRGIKIHPEFQNIRIDAPDVLDMLAPFEGRLPVLIHAGDYRMDHSSPERIKHVVRALPNLTLVCAHLGGWTVWEEAAAQLTGENIWVDTSSALFALTPERAAEIIREYNVDRVVFGSDFPMWSPVSEMQRFNRLPLTDEERKKILWTNHLKLFGL